jgi:hypothetical protein
MVRGKSSAEIQELFITPDALEEMMDQLTTDEKTHTSHTEVKKK